MPDEKFPAEREISLLGQAFQNAVAIAVHRDPLLPPPGLAGVAAPAELSGREAVCHPTTENETALARLADLHGEVGALSGGTACQLDTDLQASARSLASMFGIDQRSARI
ncbi:hypothetical protein [Paracoccus benzoatiresistens]|uniref:Uncharacterized protein n=1 Tax=Paracoccus benzoatiresistens TaxID=2997341 RepID=A0ABT4JAW4_9RHOB|nr:hypothetical protein [Paracoccus sp. EF6]MCZ0964264.1 hypothetical protein [Paracoccus sp. EF6]